MKQIRLRSLDLENFKGIKLFSFTPDGADAAINGANATGKTTIYDAMNWLLFGKDSLNSAAFEIKPLASDGKPAHGLSHSVGATLLVGEKVLGLRKIYSEKYTKKRGSAKPEMTGHTTDHWVDGVPATKGEFDAKIKELIDEEAFRLLTSPRYFNEQLHWSKRRAALLDVCGDIDTEDIVKSDKGLKALPAILGDRSIEDHRKVVGSRMKEINKELEKIPVRIDESQKNRPDLPKESEADLKAAITAAEAEKQTLETELLTLTSGGQVAVLTKQLREVEAQIQAATNATQDGHRKAIKTKQDESDKLFEAQRLKQREAQGVRDIITAMETAIKKQEAGLKQLHSNWYIENDKPFQWETLNVCPTCSQEIPEAQQEAARAEALARFNEAKAKAQSLINSQGVSLKAECNQLKVDIPAQKEKLSALQKEIDTINAEWAGVEATIDRLSETKPALNGSGVLDLAEKAGAIETEIAALGAGDTAEQKAAIVVKIAELNERLTALRKALADIAAVKASSARVTELMDSEKTLAAEYERLESELFLIETFVRAKVNLLEDRINAHFIMARFKLFSEQINGGLTECCEVMVDGVPYGSLNNAARTQIGIDIINTLIKHYGVSAPIFIDNRESITALPDCSAQIISLIVDPESKELTIETAAMDKAA